ncbi:T-cell leukemia translocation-altered gene protein homolog [Cololabis saira]|uniref:T-cell leukemia translocation-altered gene protein homolog n=1 Tax=Cololabis saira TaxID=129043 RepID=UPI002AD1E52D|nr:T-cell leukemia translocation-altered gene protein homolog [Cololabis saira]
MDEAWSFEFLSRIADSCVSFLSEFVEDWLTNDMRVSIFKILFSWLIFSLIAIHFAWKVYGNTVNDMYYRQGTGQNGSTPDAAPHLSAWESKAGDIPKSHRE